jgi:hypothetical protein
MNLQRHQNYFEIREPTFLPANLRSPQREAFASVQGWVEKVCAIDCIDFVTMRSGCEADDRVLGEAWWSEEASA